MKRDKDTADMFPELSQERRKPPTEQEKYDRLIIQKFQTDFFKGNNEKAKN